MFDALYARQSVEKTDSISIENQLLYCRYETHGNPFREYTDAGYSGGTTHRPAFEQMLSDIEHGKIRRVIVYRLDQISRSILDFTNMMDFFRKFHVEFISSTEHFDTASPIGRAMLHICVVFAQLERETIQKRILDTCRTRARQGFYMGGRLPYGFSKTPFYLDGRKTSMYVPVPEEASQIRLIYSLYKDPSCSLGDIVTFLNRHGVIHLRGGTWNTARLSELLKNLSPLVPPDVGSSPDIQEVKQKLSELDSELSVLSEKLLIAHPSLVTEINRKASLLSEQQKALKHTLASLRETSLPASFPSISSPDTLWEQLSFKDKQTVFHLLVQKAEISKERITVFWNL